MSEEYVQDPALSEKLVRAESALKVILGDLLSPAEAVQILEERDRNVDVTAAGTTAVGNPVHVDFAEFDFDPSPSTRR